MKSFFRRQRPTSLRERGKGKVRWTIWELTALVVSIIMMATPLLAAISSAIFPFNAQGQIVDGLAPFSKGILASHLYPATGATPWVILGDGPYLIFFTLLISLFLFLKVYRKFYPFFITQELPPISNN